MRQGTAMWLRVGQILFCFGHIFTQFEQVWAEFDQHCIGLDQCWAQVDRLWTGIGAKCGPASIEFGPLFDTVRQFRPNVSFDKLWADFHHMLADIDEHGSMWSILFGLRPGLGQLRPNLGHSWAKFGQAWPS